MWVCTDWKINWEAISAVGTAGAAIIALLLWLADSRRRRADRRATARLLSQFMLGGVAVVQVALARLRESFAELEYLDGDQALEVIRSSREFRASIENQMPAVIHEFPSQFLDKAEALPEQVSNPLANALVTCRRLHALLKLLLAERDIGRIGEMMPALRSLVLDSQATTDVAFAALIKQVSGSWFRRGIIALGKWAEARSQS
jgi:hypothetical protein